MAPFRVFPRDLSSRCSIAHSDRHIASEGIRLNRTVRPSREELAGVPGAFVVHGLLTPSECGQLIEQFETIGLAPKISRRPGPPIRTSQRLLYEPHPSLLQSLEERLRPMLYPEVLASTGPEWRFATPTLGAVWRVNRYSGAEVFRPHFDSGHATDENHRTMMSMVLYLNACEEGETVFFPGGHRRAGMPPALRDAAEVRVRPTAGSALIFMHHGPLSPLHSGLETTSTKYIIRADLSCVRPAPTLADRLIHGDAGHHRPAARPLVLLLGPAGAGKTTQASSLAAALGFTPVCLGDHIRRIRAEDSPLGDTLRRDAAERDAILGRSPGDPRVPGGFLRDAVSQAVLQSALAAVPPGTGVVLEGFPRSRSQSVLLETASLELLAAVSLEVDAAERADRLDRRGRPGDETSSRPARDTDWETITAPLLPHYDKRRQLVRVDGSGGADAVTQRIEHALQKRANLRWLSHLPQSIRDHLPSLQEPDALRYTRRPCTRVIRVGDRFLKASLETDASAHRCAAAAHHFAPLETPRLVAHQRHEGVELTVTTAIEGRDLKVWARACTDDAERGQLCRTLAGTLRRLHDAPLLKASTSKPPDHHAIARGRLDAGRVPLRNFTPKYGVSTPPRSRSELDQRFAALTPPRVALSRIHGDPCLPNWIARDGHIVGVVDVGSHGIGPRGIDLALAVWSIRHNLSRVWAERFLELYGREKVTDLAYYTELIRFLA